MIPPERSALRPVGRLYDALADPARANRTAVFVLLAFTALYTLYAVVSNASTSVHWDVAELVGWSRDMTWGNKHPPLATGMVLTWFSVFPLADWAAYLLSVAVRAGAIWIAWVLMGEWLDAERRVLGFAMLMLIPLYTFQGLKFNHNGAMMPLWAAATLFFLRSVLRDGRLQPLLAGAAGAGALLTKYWSVNLVAGLGLAAIFDRRRSAFFRSPVPWIMVATMAVLLIPHILWLLSAGDAAADYARKISVDNASRVRSLSYLAGSLGYVALPILLFAWHRPSRQAIRDTFWPTDDNRRLVAMALWIPFILPAVLNLLLPTRLSSVWTMPNWTLLPVVLLGSRHLRVSRNVGVAALALALALPLLALAAAPMVAIQAHRNPRFPQAHFQLLGEETQRVWRSSTSAPLAVLGGEEQLSSGAVFYVPDRPVVLPRETLDSLTTARIESDGMAVLCRPDDAECTSFLGRVREQWTSALFDVTLARTFRGERGEARQYLILVVPPPRF